MLSCSNVKAESKHAEHVRAFTYTNMCCVGVDMCRYGTPVLAMAQMLLRLGESPCQHHLLSIDSMLSRVASGLAPHNSFLIDLHCLTPCAMELEHCVALLFKPAVSNRYLCKAFR